MSTDTVKLTGPENWKAWNQRFINTAEQNRIWDLINPASATRGTFMERPVLPNVANYPKCLTSPAGSTRAASTGTQGAGASSDTVRGTPSSQDTPQSERVGTTSRPANISEMTTEGKEQYNEDLREYHRQYKLWDKEGQQIANLKAWLADHNNVAPSIYTAACKPGKGLHEWYDALKERAGVDKAQETYQAIDHYNAAVKPLTRKPKDMHAWLLNWQTAIEEAQGAELPGATTSRTWWPQFAAAVRNAGYQSWCESYRNTYRESIDNNTFSVHKLVRDFRERLRDDDDVKNNKVGKGAFVGWVDEIEKEEAHKKTPERSRRPTRSPGRGRAQSRSPARRGGKRKHPESRCPACDGNHTLAECWAARPEIRPADRYRSKRAEDLARERMERDPDLRQLVEKLRKRMKVEHDDKKGPIKGILKSSDDTVEN